MKFIETILLRFSVIVLLNDINQTGPRNNVKRCIFEMFKITLIISQISFKCTKSDVSVDLQDLLWALEIPMDDLTAVEIVHPLGDILGPFDDLLRCKTGAAVEELK